MTLNDLLLPLEEKGFQALLTGYQAICFYEKKTEQIHDFDIITSADITQLGYIYDDIEFSVGHYIDAKITSGNITINFHCLISKNKNLFSELNKISEHYPSNIFKLFYAPLEDKFYDVSLCYANLRQKIINIKNTGEITPEFMAEIISLVYTHGFSLENNSKKILNTTILKKQHVDIKYILELILKCPNAYEPLKIADSLGLLELCIPELAETKTTFQDKEHHPEGDVFTHTLECFKYIDNSDLSLSLALLLHDIAKPDTAVKNTDRRFPQHAYFGSKKANQILSKAGFSKEITDKSSFLIENHLLSREVARRNDNERKDFFNHKDFPALLKLYKADINGCFGDPSEYYRISALYNKERRIKHNIK